MSFKARDSRGCSVNGNTGVPLVHEPPAPARKHRYVAVTSRLLLYDVLNARTSEKNGAPPTIDAAAGSVTNCALSAAIRDIADIAIAPITR